MDRVQVFPGAIPLETDILNTNKNAMVALGKLAGALFGSSSYINGLAVAANSPAALNVVAQPGELYSLQNIDSSAYSSLAADTAHQVIKQGILLDAATLATPAPGTAGQSINYLIQAAFSEVDSGATVLPYYNASNPSQAYSGPANAGTTNNTVRKNTITLSAKAGVAATTGSQTTPAADSGYIGLYVVTVANGQTSVTAGNIAMLTGAPYIGAPIATGRLLNVRTFTAPTTYTPTAGTKSIVVEVLGGGGAGGGAAPTGAGQVSAGSGGGAGGYSRGYITSGFSGVAIAVGAAGVPAAGAAGGNGGSSSFGAAISATGGTGGSLGAAQSNTTVASAGAAAGGTGTGGSILNAQGGTGKFAIYATSATSGEGGASAFGTGGAFVSGTSSGTNAPTSGSGGAGGALGPSSGAGAAGGNGAAGVVIVYEYA